MAFCQKCGAQLAEDAKFCAGCGSQVGSTGPVKVSVGEVRKCPQCGQVLGALDAKCPACGHEITGVKAVNSVREFFEMYQKETNERKQLELIKNYPIPNTKEDLLEFAHLTAQQIKFYSKSLETKMTNPAAQMNNIYGKGGMFGMYKNMFVGSKEEDTSVPQEDFFAAWKDKADQVNSKAELLFAGDSDTISKIQSVLGDAVAANKSLDNKKAKQKKIMIISIVGVVIFLVIMYGAIGIWLGKSSSSGKAKENALETSYQQVKELISSGKYDEAQLMIPDLVDTTNTYTDKNVWAPRREALQKMIDEKKGKK